MVRSGDNVSPFFCYSHYRGFFPSFLLRWLKTTLMELYLIPSWDSSYIDSPLSDLGIDQCHQLREFLEKPCAEPNAATDFELLTKGEGRSVLVSSQLRRAAATLAIGLTDRLQRTREPVYLHSACQEISRNFDTQSLAPMGGVPSLKDVHDLDDVVQFNGDYNDGNKTLSLTGAAHVSTRPHVHVSLCGRCRLPTCHRPLPGVKRLQRFAEWVSERPDDEEAVIVAGHSLWFRSFFQVLAAIPCHSHRRSSSMHGLSSVFFHRFKRAHSGCVTLVCNLDAALLTAELDAHLQEAQDRQLRRDRPHAAT